MCVFPGKIRNKELGEAKSGVSHFSGISKVRIVSRTLSGLSLAFHNSLVSLVSAYKSERAQSVEKIAWVPLHNSFLISQQNSGRILL